MYSVLGPGAACPVGIGFPRRSLKTNGGGLKHIVFISQGLLSLWHIHRINSPYIWLKKYILQAFIFAIWSFLAECYSKWACQMLFCTLNKASFHGYMYNRISFVCNKISSDPTVLRSIHHLKRTTKLCLRYVKKECWRIQCTNRTRTENNCSPSRKKYRLTHIFLLCKLSLVVICKYD